ncbi:HMA2 domain-containing protein [Vibrio sp. WXL210]|uniref:HMA2 domain-containing protein n=1 Tax=Vibrio sp. WXL210 TaxID=3450709 RepID=UPI003EC94416
MRIGHHIPGRVRLKYKLGIVAHLASYRSDDIEQAIAAIPAFKDYKLNTATGSVLIEYDAKLISPEWIDALFAQSESQAREACYAIAGSMTTNGVTNE